ncbi:MAG: hypothetical protein WDO71_10455 [Bacteroidota bacterium]
MRRNIALIKGGTYNFTHCTVASYSNNYIQHKDPVLQVSNFDATNAIKALEAAFRNCIFWGENGIVDNEIAVNKAVNTGATAYSVNFSYNLWKLQAVPPTLTTNQFNITPPSPLFDSIDVSRQYYNFRLRNDSPAKNKGVSTAIVIDLDGKPRSVPVGQPDLGCFEKQ